MSPGKVHIPQPSGEASKVGSTFQLLPQGLSASPRLIFGHCLLASRAPWDKQRCHCLPCLFLLPPHHSSSSVLAQMSRPGFSQTTCSPCATPSSPSHSREMLPATSAAVPKPLGLGGGSMETKFKQQQQLVLSRSYPNTEGFQSNPGSTGHSVCMECPN